MDDRGKTVNSYNYTPFGVAYNIHEKITQPYRYTGRRWDSNLGKLWYRTRGYDAGRGVFTQADKWQNSVMNPVGYHAYGYVNGNPVLWVDPYGYKYYNHLSTRKAVLDGIKNDSWFIFAGHGAASRTEHSFWEKLTGKPPRKYTASITHQTNDWFISMKDKDFLDAIEERKKSATKIKFAVFFACESIEFAEKFGEISDVTTGLGTEETGGVLWGYANLFAKAIEDGETVFEAMNEGEKVATTSTEATLFSKAITNINKMLKYPIFKKVSYEYRRVIPNPSKKECKDHE
jgi:RHS repeat-associated protein